MDSAAETNCSEVLEGEERDTAAKNQGANCVKVVRRCLGLSHQCANGEVA